MLKNISPVSFRASYAETKKVNYRLKTSNWNSDNFESNVKALEEMLSYGDIFGEKTAQSKGKNVLTMQSDKSSNRLILEDTLMTSTKAFYSTDNKVMVTSLDYYELDTHQEKNLFNNIASHLKKVSAFLKKTQQSQQPDMNVFDKLQRAQHSLYKRIEDLKMSFLEELKVNIPILPDEHL